jgi:hypothetical protein
MYLVGTIALLCMLMILLLSLEGQSGGVDEEFFTKSFEDVHKVQVGIKILQVTQT